MSSSFSTTPARPSRSGTRRGAPQRSLLEVCREPKSANVSVLQREVHGEAEQKRWTEESGEGRPSVRALHGSVAQDEDLRSSLRLNLTCFLSPLQDLSSKDLKKDLYIVAHVIRTGNRNDRRTEAPLCGGVRD